MNATLLPVEESSGPMSGPVAGAMDFLFGNARTYNHFEDKPVADHLLLEAVRVALLGPTSANCLPMRLAFVRTAEAKARLKPALDDGNVEKTMAAPVVAIVAYDHEFYEQLPTLFPHADARSWFVGNDKLITDTSFRNSSLQGAYLIVALRSLGLDCGPMSGFDPSAVDAAFFAGTTLRSNFICNIGYGLKDMLQARKPRLAARAVSQFV